MIHLDTSFLIRALVPDSSQDHILRQWIGKHTPLGMSTIAWTEFLCGPVDQTQVELATHIIPQHVAFVEKDAQEAARLFNASGRRRGSLIDCMIAAVAIDAGASLATANVEDFRRFEVEGLSMAEN